MGGMMMNCCTWDELQVTRQGMMNWGVTWEHLKLTTGPTLDKKERPFSCNKIKVWCRANKFSRFQEEIIPICSNFLGPTMIWETTWKMLHWQERSSSPERIEFSLLNRSNLLFREHQKGDMELTLTSTSSLVNSLKGKLKSEWFQKNKRTWRLLLRSWPSMFTSFIVKKRILFSCCQQNTKPSLKELHRSIWKTGRMTSKSFLCTQADKDSMITLQIKRKTSKDLLFHHQTSTTNAASPNPKTKTLVTLLLWDSRLEGMTRMPISTCKLFRQDNKWRH